jgi:hypothetical protein
MGVHGSYRGPVTRRRDARIYELGAGGFIAGRRRLEEMLEIVGAGA